MIFPIVFKTVAEVRNFRAILDFKFKYCRGEIKIVSFVHRQDKLVL